MKIVCLVKEVPDSEAKITVENGKIKETGVKFIVNPYDEYGIEEALKIKEAGGEHQVFILTFGTERAKKVMESAMALGADEGFLVADGSAPDCDSHTTAKVLAAALNKIGFDMIFCGKQAIDDDSSQVGVRVAEMLSLGHASVVNKFELTDGKVKVERQIQGGQEVIEMPVPCVITCQKGLNDPRYPSLKNIMAVKKKPRTVFTLDDIGLSADDVGVNGSFVEVTKFEPPLEKAPGRVIEGEPEDTAKELIRSLREEAKVI
ncbi:electron transfer flavoprotein subunit beta/FixA family protein [bacterium]|nr:electron transfer flavoprotein subunit beta/FixA family protein [bacterium]